MCCSQIWQNFGGDEYLCKLGKEYLNASICKFVIYLLRHSETFDVSHVFLPLIIAKLSTFKQVGFFLAHPVYHYSQGGAMLLLLCHPDREFGICILT